MRKDGKLVKKNVNYSDVRQSIRDMTRIYKPTDTPAFVKDFIRKYNIQKGKEAELEAIVIDEMIKLNKKGEDSK